MRALPLKHPAHALRCPSQSGDLKVKCPSNRTLNVNGPLIVIVGLFTAAVSQNALTSLQNSFFIESELRIAVGLSLVA